MVNSGELIGTTEYPMLYKRYHLSQCRYNRVRQHMFVNTTRNLFVFYENRLRGRRTFLMDVNIIPFAHVLLRWYEF
jgi:hypothetical protein